MIREPISRGWQIRLGVASVLLLILLYSLLSSSRQDTVRRQQQETAEKRLLQIEQSQVELDQRLRQADALDEQERTQEIGRITQASQRLDSDKAKWSLLREQPDAVDLTIPSWRVLFQQGLIRTITPQGSFERKEIWMLSDFKHSALRLVVGLLIGAVVSLVAGLLMGCSDHIESFLMPIFAVLSKVPATAVLPIFFVLVQINFRMYIAIIVFGMLPTLAQSISQSVRKDVPMEMLFKAFTLGASLLEAVWEVVFQQVLPRVLDACRLQIGPALVLLVAAEWMVAGEGIGYRLRLFYQRTDMSVIFVYVIALGIIGLALDYSLIWLRRMLCPWFGE